MTALFQASSLLTISSPTPSRFVLPLPVHTACDCDRHLLFGVASNDFVMCTSQTLAGTLKAAKKQKIIHYASELLLQGRSDNEVITLYAPGKTVMRLLFGHLRIRIREMS